MRMFKHRRLIKRGLTSAVKRVSGERHPALVYLDRGVAPRLLTALLLLAAVTFVVAKGRVSVLRLTLGRQAKQDIVATRAFRYEDRAKREQVMAEERAKVPAISCLDRVKTSQIFDSYEAFLAEVGRANEAAGEPGEVETRRRALEKKAAELFPKFDSVQINELLSDPQFATRIGKLRQVVLALADVRTYQKAPPQLDTGHECISAAAFRRRLDSEVEKAFEGQGDEVVAVLKVIASDAAVFEDDRATIAMLQNQRAKAVPAQYTEVRRLETIISEGEKVTPLHMEKLRAFNEALKAAVSRETRYSYRASVGVAVAVLLGLGALYLSRFERRVLQSNSKLVLIGVVSLVALGLSKAIALIDAPSEFWRNVLQYPVLVALPAMVVAMAFTVRLAFVVTLVLAILSGIHYEVTTAEMTIIPMFVLLGVVEGSAAALYARTIRYRREFIRSGMIIGLANFLVIAVVGIVGGQSPETFVPQGVGGLAAGVAATILTWLLLPSLEVAFRITTNISLVELGDSNHPLLKRMVMEAPGTYHHSLIVGNLAESASEAIGANPLLARVGALYHDIGKLKKPDYFSENELHGRSRHDTLIPSMSSLIITSHVKDGIDLGVKYRLKPAILDIVREHHGTSLVYFFYKRAEQLTDEDASVNEADFRYPGPLPQSKEAAIIMLADAVEAAARAMEKPTASKIKTLVRDLILARFNDGQLDESELTLRDLHRIQESFIHIILGSLHQRVKYPKEGEPGEEEPREAKAAEPEPTVAQNRAGQQPARTP
jgi:putative nucleotidyltransferase with HDIG domain